MAGFPVVTAPTERLPVAELVPEKGGCPTVGSHVIDDLPRCDAVERIDRPTSRAVAHDRRLAVGAVTAESMALQERTRTQRPAVAVAHRCAGEWGQRLRNGWAGSRQRARHVTPPRWVFGDDDARRGPPGESAWGSASTDARPRQRAGGSAASRACDHGVG